MSLLDLHARTLTHTHTHTHTHTGRAMFAKRDGMHVADHAVEEMLAGAADSCVLMCGMARGRAGGVLSRWL